MTMIKICGITTPEEIGWLNELCPEYAGFVLFFPKSKRNISIQRAGELLPLLDPSISPTAVVVSPTGNQIRQICDAGFHRVQIHGTMPEPWPEDVTLPIWRAVNAGELPNYEQLLQDERITGFVFDASEPGSGKTFDWNTLKELPATKKTVFLAGGLDPSNVTDAIRAVSPDGVDVSSGVERVEGAGKDPDRVRAFIRAVRC